jgi:PAS domain S-box-containing protein
MLPENQAGWSSSLKPGDHLCNLYKSEAERRAVLTSFVSQGLERGEKILLIQEDTEDGQILEDLIEAGLDIQVLTDRRKIKLATMVEPELQDVPGDPDYLIALLQEETQLALAEGYPAVRATTEMGWLKRNPWRSERLIESEIQLHDFFTSHPCLGLFQFDMMQFDPGLLLKVLASHKQIVIGTEIYENIYYIPPKELLKRNFLEAALSFFLSNLEARTKTEAIWTNLLAMTNDAILLVDQGQHILTFNTGAERIFGYRAEEVISESIDLLMPTRFVEQHQQIIRQYLDSTQITGKMGRQEEPIGRRKDGSEFPVEATVTRISQNGEKLFTVILRDISKRKRIEAKAQEELRRFQDLFQGIPIPTYIWQRKDDDFILVNCNQAAEDFTGGRISEIVGKKVTELYADMPEVIADFARCFREKTTIKREMKYLTRLTGRWGYFSTHYVYVDPDVVLVHAEEITKQKEIESSLHESEERFRQLAENIQEVFWMSSPDGDEILYISPAFEKMYGRSVQSVYDNVTTWVEAIHPNDKNRVLEALGNHQLAEGKFNVKYRITRPDRSMRWIWDRGFPIHNERGEVYRVVGIAEDITDRVRTEEALRSQAKRLNTLREIERLILQSQSLETIAQSALDELVKIAPHFGASVVLFNLDRSEGRVLWDYYYGHEDLHLGPIIPLDIFGDLDDLRRGQMFRLEDLEILTNRGAVLQTLYELGLRSFISVPLITREELVGVLNLGSASPGGFPSEWVHLAQEVANSMAVAIQQTRLSNRIQTGRERLRELSRKILATQEDERRKISRELHDEASQALMALKISLDLLQKDLPEEASTLSQNLQESIELTDETMEKIRVLAQGLRPPELDAIGLDPVLEDYCEEFTKRTKLKVVYLGSELPDLSDEVSICFYRVLQEALTNVVKHAQATHVQVSVQFTGDQIVLAVQDDGRGFNYSPERPLPNNKGIGILGMIERLELLKGTLEIDTMPGSGTHLFARIPWEGAS